MAPHYDSHSPDPLAAARQAMENGDLTSAARQIGSALGEDPNRADALGLLGELIHAAPDPLDLIPSDDDLPTPSGLRAVHAYILADQGRIPEAIDILLDLIGERPDVLYIDWVLGWLQHPEAAGRIDIDRLAAFVGSLVEQFPVLTAPHAGGRDTLTRMPLFIQLVRRTHSADAHFLIVSVALLRQLGNLDEALKMAREAYALEPGGPTASALAATHATRDELDLALKHYREAMEHDPADLSARVQMADLLVHHDQREEAEEMFAEILEQEPDHEAALPSYCFLRFLASNEESWREKLLALAQDQPENERAQWVAQRLTPFVGYLPDPPDETHFVQKPARERDGNTLWLTRVIAPSNYLVFDWLRERDVAIAHAPKPDPRLPRRDVAYLLWRYEDAKPRVAVAPPQSSAPHMIAEIASQPYQLDAWWGMARRTARQIGADNVDDILASMVYPPGLSLVDHPVGWLFRMQTAAALVLAHLDEGWEDSVRRRALLSLVGGPVDWTVSAALIALAALAAEEEEAAAEVHGVFRALRQSLQADELACFVPALLWCAQRLPDVDHEERAELRARARTWQDRREAERHYRQALELLEKGEVEPAVRELSETVRLDPQSADAFRDRGALALKRSRVQEALADFTQALQLQPGMAAAHLGRGQAHLKLGKIDQAISDFTEAARLAPWDWQPWYRRGLAYLARKEHTQAAADFSEVIRLAPEMPDAYMQRALACTHLGQLDRAVADHTEQIRLNPEAPLAYSYRARLYRRQGRLQAALADFQRACELDPGNANTHSQLAWIWATCPDAGVRNGEKATASALKACELTEWKKAHCLEALAAAHAESGRFDEAVQWCQRAVELASDADRPACASRLDAYRRREPWRETA